MESPFPADPGAFRRIWHSIRGRVLAGLLVAAPVLITAWVVVWFYTVLERFVIDPLARLVLWKVRGGSPDAPLPGWFENFVAPVAATVIALVLLYALGLTARTRLRDAIDWLLMQVPVISMIYGGVRKVFQALDRPAGQARPQRVVLIAFPHPGMRVPAFVTGTCRDQETGRSILCVYVPTTPVPTSGYFLLIPEDEVTELDWTTEQALQAIVSAGLTAPPTVRYFSSYPAQPALGRTEAPAQLKSDVLNGGAS